MGRMSVRLYGEQLEKVDCCKKSGSVVTVDGRCEEGSSTENR